MEKTYQNLLRRSLVYLVLIIILPISGNVIKAQENTPANNNQTNTNAAPSATPTPIPFSEIIAQAESASALLKQLSSGVADDTTAAIVERDLPNLTNEIDARLEETTRVIEGRASLEKLKSFENEWRSLTKNLPDWKKNLTNRAKTLEDDLKQLDMLDEKWKKTRAELQTAETPPEILARIEGIISDIAQTRRQIEAEQTRVVALQSKVAEQQKRVDGAIESIKQTRDSLVGQLLVQDSAPLWSSNFQAQAQKDISQSAKNSITAQFTTLKDFAGRNADKLIIHLLVFVLFAGILFFLRRRAKPWIEKEPELKKAAIIFYLPISTALVLAILVSRWIYPQTPQILGAIFGAIALVPTIIILRKLVERPVYPLLYSLVVFYFIDQLRTIVEPLIVVSRLVFLAEMLGGFLFFLWLYLARLSKNETEKIVHGKIFRTIKIAALVALPIFALSFLANIFGYVTLARILGNAVLRSAYTAVILYAGVRIIDGLIIFALRFRPLNLLGMVKEYRFLIQNRMRKFLRLAAFVLWLIITLDLLALREPLFDWLKTIFTTELKLGSLAISLGDILEFSLTIWAAFLISRFIRFALEEDVYPRISISRGVPYAISTLLHYVLLLLGFFFALAIIGFDLTKFTILAGAFGVGIGFGLQNIVNNFVSGLILLFERPVNVGDTVQIGTDEGDLKRIGLRASVLRTYQGSEIIVPNSELISGKVVNWTFSDQQRRIDIKVGAAYGTDPKRVIEILTKVAANNENIMKTPAPRTLFLGFGDNSLDFQLRAWTDKYSSWIGIKSDLTVAVHDALVAAKIEIPFPQRDLHLRSVSPEAATAIGGDVLKPETAGDENKN